MSASTTATQELAFAGLARQAELVASGEVSSRELTELYLERIARLDPQLNAFRVVLAERALAEADQADGRARGGDRRPLLGVPVAIKDDSDVAGEVTALGTNAHGGPVTADSEVVRRLRAAGAVVIGKTNVPELTIVPFTETPTFGTTRNPWDLQRTPGGSSGGTAAAVAAGLVGGALGSDGGGSIRIPAACTGLFGLKPQRDRVPTAPAVDPWHGLSVFGPLTRRVADTALFLDAVSEGAEPLMPAVERAPGKLRIAVSLKVPPPITAAADAEQREAVFDAVELLRSLGHDVIERDPDYGQVTLSFSARYLSGIRDEARRMEHPERLARRTRGYARLGSLIPAATLAKARAAEAQDARRLNAIFDDVDVVLTPMFTRRPIPIGEYEGRSALWTFNGTGRWVPFCEAWNVIGQPAASVPMGFAADGFPRAVQFMGRRADEATLVSLAAQIEAERPWADRLPPFAAG